MAAVKTTKSRCVVYVLVLFVLANFAAAQEEPNLVAWWKLDDGSGTIAQDSAGDANGTLVNGPVWTTGKVDGALDLDGSDDYVSVPGVSGSGAVDNMTIACWIYPEITADYRAIYNHYDFAAGGVHFQLTSSSTLQLAVVGTSYFYTVSTFSANQWYHVAVVYSNSSGQNYARFYINGVGEGSIPVDTGAQVDLTKTALIGACHMGVGTIGRHFDGRIDDLRIYDSVVSETRIKQLAGLAESPTPSDGMTGVSVETQLSFTPNPLAVSHDVYIDTNNPPTTLVADDIPGATCDPGPLDYNTVYYWQVDENTAAGTITGDVWSFSTAWLTEPVGTAFTFQGRLLDDNVAADGVYDFQFKLFDSADEAYSKQQGGDVNTPDVDVIDGYFTVELDFGDVFFTNEARWLEIGVRPGDSNDTYATLRPRQRLTGVPYALREQKKIANLQKKNYTSALAGFISLEDCVQTVDDLTCDEKKILGVDVHDGYPIIVDAIQESTLDPNEITVTRIVTEKLWRQPALNIHAFDVHIRLIYDTGVHGFSISPSYPVYNSKDDGSYNGNFHLIASLVRDSRIVFNIVADKIKLVTQESPGYIVQVRPEPYEPFASEVQLKVRIKNEGDLSSSYRTTVTDHDPSIEPMVAQTRVLDAQEEQELTFNVRTSEMFKIGKQYKVKVSMYSAKGKLYDYVYVIF